MFEGNFGSQTVFRVCLIYDIAGLYGPANNPHVGPTSINRPGTRALPTRRWPPRAARAPASTNDREGERPPSLMSVCVYLTRLAQTKAMKKECNAVL